MYGITAGIQYAVYSSRNNRECTGRVKTDSVHIRKITFYKSGKVNGTIYSMKYNDRTNRYIVYASKNGKKKALLNSCSSGSIVTNGKYLYYESAAFLRSGSLEELTKIVNWFSII